MLAVAAAGIKAAITARDIIKRFIIIHLEGAPANRQAQPNKSICLIIKAMFMADLIQINHVDLITANTDRRLVACRQLAPINR